jgi:hypothetical protein
MPWTTGSCKRKSRPLASWPSTGWDAFAHNIDALVTIMPDPISQPVQRQLWKKMNTLHTLLQKWQQLHNSPAFGMQTSDDAKKIHDECVKVVKALKDVI